MRACVNTVSLTAVCVIACIVNLAPVVSQCTTRHCVDEDNDVSVLTTMVTRLQDSIEQLSNSVKQLTKLEETLAKQDECMYCLITTTTASHNRFADASAAANLQLLRTDRVSESNMHYSTLPIKRPPIVICY